MSGSIQVGAAVHDHELDQEPDTAGTALQQVVDLGHVEPYPAPVGAGQAPDRWEQVLGDQAHGSREGNL